MTRRKLPTVFSATLPPIAFAVLSWCPMPAAALSPVATTTPTAQAAAELTTTNAAAPQPITHDVYATWRSIQGTQISRDGQWIAYALVAQEADGELVLRRVADGHEWRVPRGTAPSFSADGRFVAFAVQPTREELDKAKKDKKKGDDAPKPGAGVMDLSTGRTDTIPRVKRFAWARDGGHHVAMLLEPAAGKKDGAKPSTPSAADSPAGEDQSAPPPADAGPAPKKAPGTELIVLDATRFKRDTYKDVADFAWSPMGDHLAYIVSVKAPAPKKSAVGDATGAPVASADPAAIAPLPSTARSDEAREGVYLQRPGKEAKPVALVSGAGTYRHLRFDEQGRQLVFVSNRDDVALRAHPRASASTPETSTPAAASTPAAEAAAEKSPDVQPDPTPFKLFYWTRGDTAATVLVSATTPGMPERWSPSEHAAPSFSKDGLRLFIGTAETPQPEPKDAPEPVKVDLWHWKDPELQSVQKVKAEREKARSYRAVVHLPSPGADPATARFVQLATPEMPTVQVNENASIALGLSERPYRALMSWEGVYMDAYAVDLQTGQARRLAQKLRHAPKLSPAGRYVAAFDAPAKRWMAWRTDTGAATDLTGRLSVRFDDEERDVPDLPSPYGLAGWTADDERVVVYDKFDLWAIHPATAQATHLTQGWGRRRQIELRYLPLDPEDAEHRPLPAEALVLAGTHDLTRDSGFYRVASAGGAPQVLLQDQKMIGGLLKAKDADRIVFTQQTFTEFPDLWTATLTLQAPQKISAANPQQSQLAWGTQELIEYTAADGRKLRALLAKPPQFDPKKRYPMMVYIYEKMTDNRYRFVPPAPSQNINVSRYVSNGYVVLRPDIVYTTGHPGRSAMNTVLPAVRQVIAKGFVDPARVGIQGHSWGAYQINYLITRTNAFRAAEAGASMANMVSGYGGIRWGTGLSRAFQYEHGQSRMAATPWDRPDLYLENSPIFQVHKVQTPYLTIHNDEDDAVPWYQGIEFFTALRRLGKEAYWFNYNGEKHGLRDRDNMKHYTVHMAEFFDHYLLGAPRPAWMDQPVPYLERGKRDVMGQFKPVGPAASPARAGAATPPPGGTGPSAQP